MTDRRHSPRRVTLPPQLPFLPFAILIAIGAAGMVLVRYRGAQG